MRPAQLYLAAMAALALLSSATLSPVVQAQSQGAQAGKNCEAAPAQPSTATEVGPHSGTKNMGSTGWSGGGLGGSHNETVPAGPTKESKSAQPETATGLDPLKSNPKPAC